MQTAITIAVIASDVEQEKKNEENLLLSSTLNPMEVASPTKPMLPLVYLSPINKEKSLHHPLAASNSTFTVYMPGYHTLKLLFLFLLCKHKLDEYKLPAKSTSTVIAGSNRYFISLTLLLDVKIDCFLILYY